MQSINYRQDIDALRGISVILVVVFHAFPDLVPGGFIGVDVFFVISGYLITSIIINSINSNDFSLWAFYERRIRRLFPALFSVLLFSMILGYIVLFPHELKQLGRHVAHSAAYIQNFALIREVGYFDVESIYKPLLHLWTLSVEEQYYVFWPVILMVAFRMRVCRPQYIIITIAALSFLGNVYFISNYPSDVYFHTLSRVWQLASGSLLAALSLRNPLPERRAFLFVGAALILATAIGIDKTTVYPGWMALLPTFGAVLFIIGNVRFNSWGGLVQIGLISYPLYLWHWVILSYLYIYLGKTPAASVILIAVLLSVIFAFLTYRYIEVIRYAKGWHIPSLLMLSIVLVGIFGLYLDKNGGMPDRMHLGYLEKFSVEFRRTPQIDDGCLEYVQNRLVNKRNFDYCRSDNLPSKRYIAVIGDSHAHAIFPGIAEQARKHGFGTILLANTSCPPLIGFLWGRKPLEIDDCKIKTRQILSIVSSDRRIEKVFMSTRGPVYIHGEVKGGFSRDNVIKSLAKVENGRQTYKKYSAGLSKTLSHIDAIEHVKMTYYFLENPELGFLPKEVVARPFDRWGISTREATVSKELYLLRMRRYRRLVNKNARANVKVRVIDPMPYLCNNEKCFSYKEEKFLYADDDHFSVFGSKYIADKISRIMF